MIIKSRFWWGMVMVLGILFFGQIQIRANTVVNSTSDGNQTVVVEGEEGGTAGSGNNVVVEGGVNLQNSSEPRLETGSVNPQFGGPGEYIFQTNFYDPQGREPEYVKIYLIGVGAVKDIENLKPYLMEKGAVGPQGTAYALHKNLTEEGQYQFYFEAKIGKEILHNPYYGGQDCVPGLCPDCCGTWGGPKILSENLISDHKIYLFDTNQKTPLWSYDVGHNWVTDVAFSADGQKMAAADNNGNLYMFNIDSNQPIWKYTAEFDRNNGNIAGGIGLVDFSADKWLVASLYGQVFLFDIDNPQPVWKHNIGMTLRGLNISKDGEYISAGGHDTKVYLWKRQGATPVWEYQAKSEGGILGLEGSVIRATAMTPDGKYFTAGTSCPDRSVYLFGPKSNEPIYKIKAGENFPVEAMDISDDGRYVIAVGGGSYEDAYSAILMDTDKKEAVWKFDYSRNPSISTAISGDGQWVAIGYIIDGLIMVERNSGQPVWQLRHPGYVTKVVFAKDGKSLVLGTGTYHVIQVASDGSAILQDWKVGNKIETVAISDNGQYVAAGTGLERFVSIGGAMDRNTSGSGVGPLEDLGPELVRITAGAKLESGDKLSSPDIKSKDHTWIWWLAGGILVLVTTGTIILLIKKGKIKIKPWPWQHRPPTLSKL